VSFTEVWKLEHQHYIEPLEEQIMGVFKHALFSFFSTKTLVIQWNCIKKDAWNEWSHQVLL